MKQHELDIDSAVFAQLRYELSKAIQDSIIQMKLKDLSECTVSAKIKIGLISTVDENAEVNYSVIFDPKVTSKIGRSTEKKVRGTGGRITIGDDGELLIGTNQVTMDELIDNKEA